jgi:eukaryotic-like serine/threonine-protein kinase
MTPERWQQIKGVLYDALEVPPDRRSEFLAQACDEDDTLRREVESFLALGDQDARTSFLESAGEHSTLPPGTRIRDYEVQALLGVGGMGEVYRAHDPRLQRDVAIKVLPGIFASDPERLRRFEQEARAAAALNHPNILAIYDLGTTDQGAPYVVSELLEGETLRACLRRGPLPLRKALDLTLQITGGLAVAHDKSIIHRDLKPENLFLTKDGRLKILDFGLAKLVRKVGSSSSNAPTLSRQTATGVVMGTVGYMPPEQVRGLAVDQRSDIFAVGAVVYEMLSGVRAFQGDSAADTISAILSRDPAPLSEANPAVPPAFERVVRRCLEKNPNERFHSVRDVSFALEAISDPPGSHASGRAAVPEKALPPGQRRKLYAGVLAALALCVTAGYLYYRAKAKPPAPQEWEQLTNFSDSVVAPALSPDGRMLTFVRSSQTFIGRGDVYLKLLPQGEPVQLTHDDMMKTNPSFSPDGSRIAYTVAPPWDTHFVPVLGGRAQSMLPNASGLTWVDDQHVLFSEIKSGVHMAVVTATESRADERDVYVPAPQNGMAHRSYLSPNHKWVLVASVMAPPVENEPCRLVPFDGSSLGKVVGPPAYACTYAAWSPDGQWMFFSADTGRGFHLWRQRFPDGEPEQFTFGPTEQEGIAIVPDGRSLLTSVGLASDVVLVRDKSGERQVPFEGQARLGVAQFSSRAIFSPDGSKIYFLGRRNPTEPEELWVEDLVSGTTGRAVPGISVANSYDVSPDGKQIAFDSWDTQKHTHLWVASLDRHQPPRRLESTVPESLPVFGPGGDLFFQRQEGESSYLYRRNLDTGDTEKALPGPIVRFHTISPDGKWAVAEAPVRGADTTRGVIAYRMEDGTATRLCYNLCIVRWSLDGKYIYIGILGPGNSESDFKTFVVPLRNGKTFPELPATGIKSESDVAHLRGVQVIPELAYPGPDVSRYAVSHGSVHRNIYRIPIP